MKVARQTKLAEIGTSGQEKIARARVEVVGTEFSSWVARSYLERAGVGEVAVGSETAGNQVDPRFDEMDPVAREFALGAHAAVGLLERIVRWR